MKEILSGVGTAVGYNGNQDIMFKADALIDSALTFGVTLEDIRGGQGAKLLAKYAHSSTLGMRLNNALFDMEFIAANIGSAIDTTGGDVTQIKTLVSAADGTLDVTAQAAIAQPLYAGTPIYLWYAEQGSDQWNKHAVLDGNTIPGLKTDTNYCVRYFYTEAGAETLTVKANFIPAVITIELTATLFAGEQVEGSTTGSLNRIGKVVIVIPRFMLNGTLELAMNMNGSSQMAIEGQALAVEDPTCDEDTAYYATITKHIEGSNWYDGLEDLFIEGLNDIPLGVGDVYGLTVFGKFGSTIKQLQPGQFTLATSDAGIASVFEATVTGVATGTAKITASVEVDSVVLASDILTVTVA